MNFLNPGVFAALLPLLALPFAIHLFNRHYPNSIRFPNLERIRKSMAERSRLARWRHIFMTLLRTLAVAAALLAFMKPVLDRFGSKAGNKGVEKNGRCVLLVLDRSLSMEYRTAGGTSAARNALVEAGKILETLTGEDRANVILAGSNSRVLLPEFSASSDQIRAAIAALPQSYETLSINGASQLAASLLEKEKTPGEVYFLSDFQRGNWADAALDGFPEKTRIFFVDVTKLARKTESKARQNRAILSVKKNASQFSSGQTVRLEVRVGNWTDEPATISVEAVVDGRFSVSTAIETASWSIGKGVIEFVPQNEGFHRVELRLAGDDLPMDDRHYVIVKIRQREEVTILSERKISDEDGGLEFVSAALNPFEGKEGAFAPQIISLAAMSPVRMSSASKIVVTGSGVWSSEFATRLLAFLEQGGGLVYFLDGKNDRSNLALLEKTASRVVSPFRIVGDLTTENFGGQAQKIARGNFDSRFLRLFRGENRRALGLLDFYKIQRALPTGDGEVILSFVDGTPALGSIDIGIGTALFCNFTPAEFSSNLARQELFPAWMQELVKNLTPGSLPESGYEVGDSLLARVFQKDYAGNPLSGPGGKTVDVRAASDGEMAMLNFKTDSPGFYVIGPPRNPIWIEPVNTGERETDLRQLDPETLLNRAESEGEEDESQLAFVADGSEDYQEITKGKNIFHWFLLGLAALLLIEMLLFRPFEKATGKEKSASRNS